MTALTEVWGVAPTPTASGGQNDDFRGWPIPLGGGAWGAGTNMWHSETPASYEPLPDRCRALDLFASVDAHLGQQLPSWGLYQNPHQPLPAGTGTTAYLTLLSYSLTSFWNVRTGGRWYSINLTLVSLLSDPDTLADKILPSGQSLVWLPMPKSQH